MKKTVITGLIVAFCLLIIPISFAKKGNLPALKTAAAAKVKADLPKQTQNGADDSSVSFRIKTKDKVVTLSAREYIVGVVAAEMPVSFGAEALKAQAVAAYSFALYKKASRQNEEYDLTDSFKTDQSYLDAAALKSKWGDSYEENIKIIGAAADAVAGEYLESGGEPALTLYCSLSSGKTNSCEDVFGSKLSYLVPVDSFCDTLSPDYKSVLSFSEDELNEKLSSLKQATGGNLLTEIKTADSGVVTEIKFAGVSVSGVKLAGLLGLPSPNFTAE
ncbi:MAG: SpoIID/LytB domain-containing protein, partial [Clostridia bacterium]|nr:SpoIID/LytB domain-containing protein [Clostridia bacterium]